MPDPLNPLDAASPGKQLGELGDGAKKVIEAAEEARKTGGKAATQFTNNKGGSSIIVVLLIIIGFMAWYMLTDTKQGKIDDGTRILLKVKDDRHTEDTITIREQKIQIAKLNIEKDSLSRVVWDAISSMKRQNTVIDIYKKQRK